MYLGQISEGTDGANYFSKGLAVIQELLQGQNEQDKLEELKGKDKMNKINWKN